MRLDGSSTAGHIMGAGSETGRESTGCGDERKEDLEDGGRWDLHFW